VTAHVWSGASAGIGYRGFQSMFGDPGPPGRRRTVLDLMTREQLVTAEAVKMNDVRRMVAALHVQDGTTPDKDSPVSTLPHGPASGG
jgi:hypothetical protein